MTTPDKRINISLSTWNIKPDEAKTRLNDLAFGAGFKGRHGGNLSGLLTAISELDERDRELLKTFLRTLLDKTY